jgi:hypothetical protein
MTTATPTHVLVRIPQWLAYKSDFRSRELEGHIVEVRGKGILFEGNAVVSESDNCHRCGRVIENPVSRIVGYGPICSELLGIPRDPDPALIAEYRAMVRARKIRDWLPAGRVEVLDSESGKPISLDAIVTVSAAAGALVDQAVAAHAPAAEKRRNRNEIRLAVNKGVIEIHSDIKWKDAIKSIPGRRWEKDRGERGCWVLPATPSAASMARVTLGTASLVTDAAFDALLEQAATRDRSAVHKSASDLPPVPVSKTDAWLHQRQAYWFARNLDACGLLMDMGTGKSKVVVDLVVNRQHRRTLIICPKAVVGVWPREFTRHAGMAVNVVAPKGSTKTRAKAFADAIEIEPVDAPIACVVNYEAAWRPGMKELLLGTEWDCVVLDESHKVKAPGGVASKFVAQLGRHARTRLCLTGTPMPHSPLDVYAQYRFLDPGIFGTSFAAFRNRFAIMGGYGGHEVLGYQRQDELAEKVYGIAFRVMADDVLDLPEVMHETRTCEMSASAREVYADLDADLFAEAENGTITAANALVRLLRLQQMTSGYAPIEDLDSDEVTWVPMDDAKERLLAEVLDDIPVREPVAVICRFIRDLDAVKRVCEAQGRVYGELSGRNKDGLTGEATMSPDIDVIGVQIQAGGVGIDLTRSRYGIYYSVGTSLGDFEQSLKRIHRPGQERPTTYYHLQVENTIDQRITEALVNKKDVVEYVLGLAS